MLLPSAFRPSSVTLDCLSQARKPADKQAAALSLLSEGSFLAQLIREQESAWGQSSEGKLLRTIGVTNTKAPAIVACDRCGAPLVGNKMGVTHLNFTFCDTKCRDEVQHFQEMRAYQHARLEGPIGYWAPNRKWGSSVIAKAADAQLVYKGTGYNAGFLALDTDHSGFITKDELKAACERELTAACERAGFNACYTIGDGFITKDMLESSVDVRVAFESKTAYELRFDSLDKDGDGRVSRAEWLRFEGRVDVTGEGAGTRKECCIS